MKRKNSYDFIRFLAASMVVFSHSFALIGLEEPRIGDAKVGTIGLWVFFILSGYLIAASWDQYPRFNVFMAKRALRIFPGLLTALLFSVLVVGLAFTTLNVWAYLTHSSTLHYMNNLLLYNTQFSLPGVFTSNPYPNAVNGSLWTLAYEFTLYISVALLGAVKALRKININYIWAGLFVLQWIVLVTDWSMFRTSLFYIRFDLMITLALMFTSGVVFLKRSESILLSYRKGAIALLAFMALAFLAPTITTLLAAILLAYAIFALGASPALNNFGKYGDFSYGIYIYSFPVQQSIAATIPTSSPYVMFALSLGLSVLLGGLSWRFVESKALRYKSKIDLERYPIKQSETAW